MSKLCDCIIDFREIYTQINILLYHMSHKKHQVEHRFEAKKEGYKNSFMHINVIAQVLSAILSVDHFLNTSIWPHKGV